MMLSLLIDDTVTETKTEILLDVKSFSKEPFANKSRFHMSWRRGMQGSAKSSFELWIQTRDAKTFYREKLEWRRDWPGARTILAEVTTRNVMPLGSQWPNRHQNTTDRSETQAKLNRFSSHCVSSLAWSGATPVRNKIWYPKTQEPVRQQLVRHKIQLHVGQGKGLPRSQTAILQRLYASESEQLVKIMNF